MKLRMDNFQSVTTMAPSSRASSRGSPHLPRTNTTSDQDPTPSRQSRLLQSRNARFSAKRLSVTKIGSRIAQRAKSGVTNTHEDVMKKKENTPLMLQGDVPNSYDDTSPVAHRTPKIPMRDRIASSTASPISASPAQKSIDARQSITKRHSSPLIYQSFNQKQGSPANSSISSASTGSLCLREVSGNENRTFMHDGSPRTDLYRRVRKQKSMQLKSQFDTENYIEHIENELRQAQEALISPTANRSLQHQLKSARFENDQLRRELMEMRNAFEAEVKTTLEYKATSEAELKRKVKHLEDELMGKVSVIEELEYQHEEKRLDSGTLDTLKATIERLEAEKLSMEEENRSMTKRNEVLSELLAMSPTKTHPPFELRSPVREKRPGRPMSLIIPRLPSSPIVAPAKSLVTSPATSSPLSGQASLGMEIVPFSLDMFDQRNDLQSDHTLKRNCQQATIQPPKSPSTSEVSAADSTSSPNIDTRQYPLPSSPVHGSSVRATFKRKPRKFMHGSTQLKPLLLSTLRNDSANPNSAHGLDSPCSTASFGQEGDMWEAESYFGDNMHVVTSVDSNIRDSSFAVSAPEEVYTHQTVDELLMEDARKTTAANQVSISSLGLPEGMSCENRSALPGGERSLACLSKVSELSSPFDLEALRRLPLPTPCFDRLPQSISTESRRLPSAVPEPLFSPTSKRIADNRTVAGGHGRHQHPMLAQDSHRRQQSRSAIHCSVISPIPVGIKQPTFELLHDSGHGFLQSSTVESHVGSTLKPRASPLSQAAVSISRSITPLEILQRKQFGARPLAAFTIRTICTALSRCTAFVHDIRRDPLALARKVLANAWFANWKRFGRLSWWVLGLFLPQTAGKTLPQWDWDDFDGESIAQRCCQDGLGDDHGGGLAFASSSQALSLKGQRTCDQAFDRQGPSVTEDDTKPGWCKSIFLWGKFSIAIMLAVGGAVVNGPADLLRDVEYKPPVCVRKPDYTQRMAIFAPEDGFLVDHNELRAFSEPESGTSAGQSKYGIQNTQTMEPRDNAVACDLNSSPPHPFPAMRLASRRTSADDDNCLANDLTIRPLKTRQQHIEALFKPSRSNESLRTETCTRNGSLTGSTDEGFLKWPPDL